MNHSDTPVEEVDNTPRSRSEGDAANVMRAHAPISPPACP